MRSKKAQSSLEFIYTYGWALAALLIVISLLVQFDVFNSNNFLSDYCSTGEQIRCVDIDLVSPINISSADNASLFLALRNTHPVDITINNMSFFTDNTEIIASSQIQLSAGSNVTREFDLGTLIFRPGGKQEFQIEINYRRTSGSNNYTIRGSALTTTRELR